MHAPGSGLITDAELTAAFADWRAVTGPQRPRGWAPSAVEAYLAGARKVFAFVTGHRMSDEQMMVHILKLRGYMVRHRSESTNVKSWHRPLPMPRGLDFRAEALEQIKAQITLDDIVFEERQETAATGTDPERPDVTIASAQLRLL